MKARSRIVLPAVVLATALAAAAVLGLGHFTSQAVQNPTMFLDMVTTGTTYDDSTNTMTVGSTDNCLTSPTANAATHVHQAHLVIQNVEDLVGWQVRLNYIGDKMRPNTINFAPFTDSLQAQNISFNNLPIDQSTFVHRDLVTASSIPAAPADGTNTPQTASLGASYNGAQNFAISADTPAKAVPDDSSYSAPNGGVLAGLALQVVGDESGNQLFMDVDDGSPNSPGSGIAFFNGSGSQEVFLPSSSLGDGFHAEGIGCQPTPTPTSPQRRLLQARPDRTASSS